MECLHIFHSFFYQVLVFFPLTFKSFYISLVSVTHVFLKILLKNVLIRLSMPSHTSRWKSAVAPLTYTGRPGIRQHAQPINVNSARSRPRKPANLCSVPSRSSQPSNDPSSVFQVRKIFSLAEVFERYFPGLSKEVLISPINVDVHLFLLWLKQPIS